MFSVNTVPNDLILGFSLKVNAKAFANNLIFNKMKATIAKVATDVKSVKNGETRIVNLITLSNGTVIVRDKKQFDADLKGSHLKPRQVKNLKGGIVEGDFKWHKKGDKYIANEFNTKNVDAGTELVYESDGYRVEGFLDFELNELALDREENAYAYAETKLSVLGLDEVIPTTNTDNNAAEMEAMRKELEALKNVQVGATVEP